MQDKTDWEISVGLYPGILLGFRSYKLDGSDDDGVEFIQTTHVLYIPFIDISLTIYRY